MNALEQAARAHRSFLWNLCYRMTGVAADADDLVQETFARALRRPPPDPDRTLRPWLTRIAVNAARDVLRARRRAGYLGPWLPSPVDTGSEPPAFEPEVEGHSTEGRYELLESASFAFLLALEKLNPKQRAVLLLRDVFDYPVEETAEVLELSPANVKVLHHRARKRLEEVHPDRERVSKEAVARNRQALEALMGAIVLGEVAQVERLLASDVVLLNDGGGQFHAARVPVVGATRVATFLLRLSEIRGAPDALSVRLLNGQPALVLMWRSPGGHEAPLSVVRIEVDAAGRVREVHSVLATRKLTAVHPPDDGPSGD